MTYMGPGNFLTQPIDEPSDYEEEEASNSEYNMDEVMDDGGDKFEPEVEVEAEAEVEQQ